MPTAAKLTAAILFGALGWVASGLALPLFEPGTEPARFAVVNAVLGVILGWRIAGSRARTTLSGAVGYGLTAAAALGAVSLFVHAGVLMIEESLRKRYDGPMDAVVGVFELMLEIGRTVASVEVLGTLLVGGILAGLVTEWAGRSFR